MNLEPGFQSGPGDSVDADKLLNPAPLGGGLRKNTV